MIAAVEQQYVTPEIRRYIGAFVWRRRWVALLRAVGWAIAFAGAWLILSIVCDRLFHLNRGIRAALLAANLVGILILVWRPVARLFHRRIDWTAAAAQVEARAAHHGQRLQTLTSQMLADPAYRGSEQLLGSIRGDLLPGLRRGGAARLAPLRAAGGSWGAAVAVIVIFLAMAQIFWLQMPRLLARAIEPWAPWPPVTTTMLWVQPGDAEIRAGSDLTISVRAARLGEDPPMLWISSDDGRAWQGQPMAAASVGFDLTLGNVQNDLQYFVEGGDARSDRFAIHVLRPPAVTQFRVQYVYPAYTAKPPLSVTNTDGLIEAPVGSTATIEAVCTEPLTAATLVVGDRPIAMSATSQPNIRQCEITVERDAKLQLQLIGARISGSGPATMAIHALPDLPPVVKFVEPTQDLRLGPRDTLPVTYLATDDYGVTSVSLRIQANMGAIVQIPMLLDGQPRYRRGTIQLALSQFDLKNGDLIRLSLAATDNGGHEQIGDEARYVLISNHGIDPAARMCLADLQRAAGLAEAMAANIEAAEKSLQEARQRAGGDVRDPDALAPTRQSLASAANAAAMLEPAMLAAIAHSDSPALATALCRWVDTAAVLGGAVDRAAERLDSKVQSELPARFGPVAAIARQLQQDLNTTVQGQLAAALRAQSMDSPKGDSKIIHRLDQQVHDDAATLGLDSAAADFVDRLAALIAHETELLSHQHPIDYAEVADSWARRMQQGNPPDSDMARRLDVGAQAESLRADSNLVRARDLRLAATAAPAMVSGPVAGQREQFAPALAAMQRDEIDTTQSSQIRDDANAARAKMIAWAAVAQKSPPSTQPADRDALDLAMQSNAQMARHDYAAAAKTDQALAKAAATQPSAVVARDMEAAQNIEQIRQDQDRLAAQTATAPVDQNPQLAARQQAITQAIARQDGGAVREERTSGIAAIAAATTRLAQMPAQLSEALASAAAHRQAAQQTAAAARSLAAATQPASQAAAAAALQAAKQNQAQADQRQSAAAKAVEPKVAQAMSQSLSQSSSSADAAASTIDRQLAPALRQLRQGMDASDAAGTDRAVSLAAAAVAAAQDQLAQARSASMRRDPLASAQYFAQAAASELSNGGNRAAVGSDQRDASAALAQASQQAAHGAAMGRLGQVPSVAAMLNPANPNLTDQSGAEPATAWSVDSLPAMRQWGQLQHRPPGNISASVNQSDPAGYEESLKAYFEALNGAAIPAGEK
jgi:hypothetical protein